MYHGNVGSEQKQTLGGGHIGILCTTFIIVLYIFNYSKIGSLLKQKCVFPSPSLSKEPGASLQVRAHHRASGTPDTGCSGLNVLCPLEFIVED